MKSCRIHPGSPQSGAGEGLCARCVLEALDDSGRRSSRELRGRLQPGEWLGPYRIERLLGRGGSGEVYAAEDAEQGRRVAIKLLSDAFLNANDIERLAHECELAARINHPNSVYVFGTRQIEDHCFIVMELVDGGTLSQLVAQSGPLPIAAAVDATLQILAGLGAAHRAGVLHRDIKPSNCFVEGDRVKVGDFGLSIRSAGPSESTESNGPGYGTPGFAPPEQLRGAQLDVRSDLFSVGATLFFLLTGKAPGDSLGLSSIAAGISARASSVRALRHEVPQNLHVIIQKCLSANPIDRPATCEGLAKALMPFSSRGMTAAPLERRVAAATFDLILCVCAGGLVLAALLGLHQEMSPRIALGLTVAIPMLLTWGLIEGFWGAAYGKRVLGLHVVGPKGAVPGVARALVRLLVLVALPIGFATMWLLAGASEAMGPRSVAVAIAIGLTAVWAGGSRGVHERLSGTRTVMLRQEQASESFGPHSASSQRIPTDSIGPYDVVEELWTDGAERLLLGVDPLLQRDVWIHVFAGGRRRVLPMRRTSQDGQRLRWLNRQHTARFAWEAYEVERGAAFLSLGAPQGWQRVKRWLSTLAAELQAGPARARAGGELSLDRVWISADGRAMLLPFRCPGLATPAGWEGQSLSSVELLREIARLGLQGVPRHALPLTASRFLAELEGGRLLTAADVAKALGATSEDADAVTRQQRGMSLALSVVCYLVAANWAGNFLEAVSGSIKAVGPLVSADVAVAGAVSSFVIAMGSSAVLRGGLWLRACRIAVVGRDGAEVSPARAALRSALAWSWVPLSILGAALGSQLFVGLVVAGRALALVDANLNPHRAVQDRLAGTYLVPL